MRIQKYLSQKKILSRRETESYIKLGLIKVNGRFVRELGFRIDPEKDRIEVLSAGKKAPPKMTVAVYKPRGIVSSRSPSEGKTIFQLLPKFSHLNVVGRLDKESEGLLLLSNDGIVTASVTGIDHRVQKEYEVTVQETITPNMIRRFQRGFMLADGPTLPAQAKRISPHMFRITLREGRKHQIRRMADMLRLTVVRLKRVRIGNVALGGLHAGTWKVLSPQAVEVLKRTRDTKDRLPKADSPTQ